MDFGVELVCGLFYFITRDKEISKSKIENITSSKTSYSCKASSFTSFEMLGVVKNLSFVA